MPQGCSAFARRYSRNRVCFLFLRLLRRFSSPGSPLHPMHSDTGDPKVGFPHSEIPGSKLGYQLLWAYRRFQRPSSPLNAKTSAVCPYSLDRNDPKPTTDAEPNRTDAKTRRRVWLRPRSLEPARTTAIQYSCSDARSRSHTTFDADESTPHVALTYLSTCQRAGPAGRSPR